MIRSHKATQLSGILAAVVLLVAALCILAASPPGAAADPDTTAPTTDCSLSGPTGVNGTGTGWFVGPVTADITASDPDDAVAHIEWELKQEDTVLSSGSELSGALYDFPVPTTRDGVYTLRVRAIDSNENMSEWADTPVQIDTVAPGTVIMAPEETGWYNYTPLLVQFWPTLDLANVPAAWSWITDLSGMGHILYQVDPSDPPLDDKWLSLPVTGAWPPDIFTSVAGEGLHKVIGRAVDVAGNAQDPWQMLEIGIDLTPPTVTVTKPAEGEVYQLVGQDLAAEFSAEDTLSGIDYDSYPWDLTFDTESVGPKTFELTIYDVAGNFTTKTVNYTVTGGDIGGSDTTPPTTTAALVGTLGNNDWYTSAVTVNLTPDDDVGGSGMSGGQAGTWYSFDNGGSWTQGTSATKSADGTYTVLYYSKDADGNQEDNKSVTFRIDKTGPTAPTITGGGASWFKTDQTVSAGDGDDATSGVAGYQHSFDSGEWAAGASVLVSAERTTAVAFRTVDNAGNTSDPANVEVKIDKTPPLLAVFGTPGGFPDYSQWQNSDVIFGMHPFDQNPNTGYEYDCSGWDPLTFVTSDIAYSLDGGSTWIPFPFAGGMDWDWVATLPAPASHGNDGIHPILYRAIDQAGNVGTKDYLTGVTVSFTIKIDTQPPSGTVAINNGAQYTNNPHVTINSSVEDTPSGVLRMRFSVDGGEAWAVDWTAYAPTATLDLPSGDGYDTVTAEYEDQAGNTLTTTDEIGLDTTPPTMGLETILFPDPWGFVGLNPVQWINENSALFQTHDDDTGPGQSGIAGYSYIVNDAPSGPSPDHTIMSTEFRSVTIDPLPEGEHWVRLACMDNAGNWSVGGTSYDETWVRIDTVVPVVTITTPADGATYTQGATVLANFGASDGTSGLAAPASGDVANGQAINTSTLGSHSFTVTATDLAGNPASSTHHYTVNAPTDNTPPTTTATLAGTPGNNGWYKSAVTVTFTPTDNAGGSGMSGGHAGTWYSFDNGDSWTPGTSATKSADGTYTVLYYSKDAAGNEELPHKSATFKIDKTGPVVTITKPLANDYYVRNTAVNSAGGVTDVLSGVNTTALTNDTVTTSWGAALRTSTTGNHTFKVVSTDQAGNTTTVSVPYTVSRTADTTPPTVSITNPEFYDGQSYPKNEQLSIDFTVTDSLAGTSLARWSVSVKLPDGTTITPPLTSVGTNGASTGVVPALTGAKGAYMATITAKDNAGQTTSVVVRYCVAADWGLGLLAFDTIQTPSGNPPPINVTTQPIVPLKFTLSGDVRASLTDSAVLQGLKPRLYVVDLVTNKLVYKGPTYFQLGADGFYTFNFDTRNIACIPSAGRNFKHIVVFCDPLGAPKFTCGCGCGAGTTTVTDLAIAGTSTVTQLTPVTSDAGVAKLASAAPSAAVAAAAVATPVISAVAPSPAPLTTGGIAAVTLTGSNFGSKVTANFVSLKGFDANSVAWTATTQSTAQVKLGLTSWGTAKIVFTTPANVAGTMTTYVTVGTATSVAKALTVSVGSATGTIRYIRGG